MASRFPRELGLIVAWLLFPLVPVVLADCYYQTCNLNLFSTLTIGPDPREWGWFLWVVMLGPLLGYGFLAGVTLELPDDITPPLRGWRWLIGRRSVWVGIGPWCGFLTWIGLFFAYSFLANRAPMLWNVFLPQSIRGTWLESVLGWVYATFIVLTLAYAWLLPAWAALRRAARIGTFSRAFYGGLTVALAFVGSLFGGFWAATSFWRSYFFDSRVVPLIVISVGPAVICGCG